MRHSETAGLPLSSLNDRFTGNHIDEEVNDYLRKDYLIPTIQNDKKLAADPKQQRKLANFPDTTSSRTVELIDQREDSLEGILRLKPQILISDINKAHGKLDHQFPNR